jgi:hypothetical protein
MAVRTPEGVALLRLGARLDVAHASGNPELRTFVGVAALEQMAFRSACHRAERRALQLAISASSSTAPASAPLKFAANDWYDIGGRLY